MELKDIILYGIWCAFPAFYLILIIYALLERSSGNRTRADIPDYTKQMFFLIGCVLVSLGLDKTFIPWFSEEILAGMLPMGFFRIILFPCVLLIGSKLIGGSKAIKISRVARVGDLPKKGSRKK